MVGKGNLVIFESSNFSETGAAMPTKIGVHALDFNLYMHEFFEPILFNSIFSLYSSSPWSERKGNKTKRNKIYATIKTAHQTWCNAHFMVLMTSGTIRDSIRETLISFAYLRRA